MIKDNDEKMLWETVTLLKDENHHEHALVVFKNRIKKTFGLLNQPTYMLEDLNIEVPSDDVLQKFQLLDSEIYKHLVKHELEMAHEQFIDYVDLLSQVVPGEKETLQKRILAQLLAPNFSEVEHSSAVKEEVYTSSEVAEIVGVSDQTIRRWCEKGKYPEAQKTRGGHWRIPEKYFRVSLESARQRSSFEKQLNQFNKVQEEVDESEYL